MNGSVVAKVLGPLVVGGVTAGATWVATGPLVGAAAAEPRAWIDEPLDQETVPPDEPLVIVAHATDQDGVALVTLRVDGELEETVTGGGGSLVTVEIGWEPPAEGTYELEVRGTDGAGDPGAPGLATVTVSDTPEPDGSVPSTSSTTSTSTTTTVPGEVTTTTSTTDTSAPDTPPGSGSTTTTTTRPTTTTTARPCQRPAPTQTSPRDGASLRVSPTLRWTYAGCPVDGFRVEVRRVTTNPPVLSSPTLPSTQKSWTPPDGFPCDGRPWWWRVATIDGRELRWSPMWSFTC